MPHDTSHYTIGVINAMIRDTLDDLSIGYHDVLVSHCNGDVYAVHVIRSLWKRDILFYVSSTTASDTIRDTVKARSVSYGR